MSFPATRGAGRTGPLHDATFRDRVLAAILRGGTAKEGAAECGVLLAAFWRYAYQLGFRRMYVTADERALLLKNRAEQAQTVTEIKQAA